LNYGGRYSGYYTTNAAYLRRISPLLFNKPYASNSSSLG